MSASATYKRGSTRPAAVLRSLPSKNRDLPLANADSSLSRSDTARRSPAFRCPCTLPGPSRATGGRPLKPEMDRFSRHLVREIPPAGFEPAISCVKGNPEPVATGMPPCKSPGIAGDSTVRWPGRPRPAVASMFGKSSDGPKQDQPQHPQRTLGARDRSHSAAEPRSSYSISRQHARSLPRSRRRGGQRVHPSDGAWRRGKPVRLSVDPGGSLSQGLRGRCERRPADLIWIMPAKGAAHARSRTAFASGGECRTQMHLARAGTVSPEMATRRRARAPRAERGARRGRARADDHPGERRHDALEPMAIGLKARVKINANIGNSPTSSSLEEEVEKLDGVGEVGGRHGDGPLDREADRRDPRGDHRTRRRSRSARCRSTRPSSGSKRDRGADRRAARSRTSSTRRARASTT